MVSPLRTTSVAASALDALHVAAIKVLLFKGVPESKQKKPACFKLVGSGCARMCLGKTLG